MEKNEDGSANAVVEYDEEGLAVIVQHGMQAILKKGMEKMKKDLKGRMQLEDAINSLYSIVDDIKLLFENYGDSPIPMTEDEVGNTLLGIEYTARMKIKRVWDRFIQHEQLDQYASDEIKELRRKAMEGMLDEDGRC
jgi:hypothetical protein